jgi:CRP-like cAMP-binding protein
LDKLLKEKDYFGEIAFFSEEKRTVTIKSRDFTELLYINR